MDDKYFIDREEMASIPRPMLTAYAQHRIKNAVKEVTDWYGRQPREEDYESSDTAEPHLIAQMKLIAECMMRALKLNQSIYHADSIEVRVYSETEYLDIKSFFHFVSCAKGLTKQQFYRQASVGKAHYDRGLYVKEDAYWKLTGKGDPVLYLTVLGKHPTLVSPDTLLVSRGGMSFDSASRHRAVRPMQLGEIVMPQLNLHMMPLDGFEPGRIMIRIGVKGPNQIVLRSTSTRLPMTNLRL